MKSNRHLRTAVAGAAVVALALSACGGRDDAEKSGDAGGTGEAAKGFDKDATIGISLPQKTSENWVLAENLFKKGLKDKGYKGIVQFANNGAGEQQSQISSMITNGAKVIVVGAVDGSQLGTQLKQAKDAGVTIIAYDRLLLNTPNVDYYVAYDNFKVGQLQGKALLQGMEKKGKKSSYNVELVAGSPDDANSKIFWDGAMSVLEPKIKDGTLKVGSGQKSFKQAVTQGWKPENVQKRFDSIIPGTYRSKTLDGVLSPNDTLARAVMTSAKSAGKPNPIVTGQDSEKESVKSIVAGGQYSTINKDTRNLVKQTITMVNDLQAGKKPEVNDTKTYDNKVKTVPAQLLPPVIVTKANAKKAYANDPTLSKIVAAAG